MCSWVMQWSKNITLSFKAIIADTLHSELEFIVPFVPLVSIIELWSFGSPGWGLLYLFRVHLVQPQVKTGIVVLRVHTLLLL